MECSTQEEVLDLIDQGRLPMKSTILGPDVPGQEPLPLFQVPWIHSHVTQASPAVPPTIPPTSPGPVESPDVSYPEPKTFMGRMIPSKNPPALIGYYLGVFGLIIWPLAPFALVLGIIGLYRSRKIKGIGGGVHSIVAIILGVLFIGVIAMFLLL
ncbi:MAG: hypothetical protein CMJ32_02490 [Phycisphaerae bacterium]|nr:hypothetical protein [Phycisphaerae bacterium]